MYRVEVERRRGTAADLHADDPFGSATTADVLVRWSDVVRPAIVVGSRQSASLLDAAACEAAGLEIVRRRSGGGVVLLEPRSIVWVDLVVRHGRAGVPDDVRHSMIWAGERWRDALRHQIDRPLNVHIGGMECTEWSELVCFAGLGPGEIVCDGRKLLGLSQRRTRHGIRVQCLLHRDGAAPMALVRGLFAVEVPDASLLAEPATLAPGVDVGALVEDLAASLSA